MEQKEKEIIEKYLPKLLKFTKCTSEFLARLEADGVLSDSDVQEITCLNTSDHQSYRLYKVVVTRTTAFSKLLKALRDTCQTGAYNLLKNDKIQDFSGFFSVPPPGLTDILASKTCQIVAIFTPNVILTIQKIEDTSEVHILHDTSELPVLHNDAQSWKLPFVFETQNLEPPKELINLKQKIVCVIRADISELSKFIGDLDHVKCLQDKIEWSDLSENGQARVLERKVLNGELEVSLKAIQYLWLRDDDKFFHKFLKNGFLTEILFDKQPELFDIKIPEKPVVYLDRVLISRALLLKSILQWESDQDIFAISGTTEPQLRPFLRTAITKSGELLLKNEKLVGVKNVLLEYGTSFVKITKLKGSNHIHWLHYTNGNFKWIASTGNLQIIQKFISYPDNQMRTEEVLFPKEVDSELQESRQNLPVIISGLPGIGKSLLLENLARIIRTNFQDKFIILSNVSAFVKLLRKLIKKQTTSETIILECLSACLMPKYEFSKQLLTSLTHSTELKIELLLDGYDEETQDNRELLSKYMKVISEKFQSIRIWITTRPHYLNELEITLNAIGYNILELDSQLQEQLLVKHWAQKENLDIQRLEAFASIYVSGLPEQMGTKSQTLIGIPLQCAMLAEILDEWAERYSKRGNQIVPNNELPDLQINSVTDLLKMLVETKWKFFESDSSSKRIMKKEDMINVHIYQAIKLIFPEKEPQCKHLVNNNSVTMEDILRFGLMQKSKQHENLEFITHSVAEYLIALFCADLLLNESTIEDKSHQQILTYIVFNFTFAQHPTDSARFKHGNIAFYISSLLEDCKPPTNLATFMEQHNLQHMANACVYLINGINFIEFLFASDIFATDRICSIFDYNILYAAVKNNDEIATFCIQLYKEQKGVNICELKFEDNGLSLLQLCAKFNPGMVDGLINEDFKEAFKKEQDSARCLIQVLVEDSEFTSESQIKVQKEVLESLHILKPQIVHEENDEGEPPLFCKHIHISLLKMLVELGSPIHNQRNTDTVLHRAASYLTPAQYEELILSIPSEDLEKILKTENRNKSTALHILVENLVPNQQTLEMFAMNEADFNAKDDAEASILKRAIQSNASNEIIKYLIHFGAKLNEVNEDGISLLHVAATWGNLDALDVLTDLGLDVNIKDNQGNTPLHAALLQLKNPRDTYFHLERLGVDLDLENSIGLNACENVVRTNTILRHSNPLDVIEIVLMRGTKLSDEQKEALLHKLELQFGSAESASDYFTCIYKCPEIDSTSSSDGLTNILETISQRKAQQVIQDLCDNFALKYNIPLAKTYTTFWDLADISALHVAMGVGNLELVNYLLDNQHFDKELENPKMSNLLRFCVSGSKNDEANFINAKIKILSHFQEFYPKIFKSDNPLILFGDVHIVILKHLINLGADINSLNFQGQNLLHISPKYLEVNEYHELIMYILNKNLDHKDFTLVNNPGSNCFTLESTDISPPIRLVIKIGHFENEKQMKFMKKLTSLEMHGWNEETLDASESAIVLEVNENGVTMTAQGNDYAHELIIVLQKLKGTLDLISFFQCTDKTNTTTLCLAASRLELEMETIMLFLLFGVSINTPDKARNTPLAAGIEGGAHSEFLKRLVIFGADPFKELFDGMTLIHLAVLFGNPSAVEFCIYSGMTVNDANDDGWTPLHIALLRSNPHTLTVIKLLVAAGADLNKVNNDGFIPILLAIFQIRNREAECIQLEAVKYLIKNGANPLITDSDNNTFLHIAPKYVTPKQYHELVEHLIKNKHDQILSLTNNKHLTTLHSAVKFLEPLESTLKLYKIRKFDFNSVDEFGQSILHCASAEGRSVKFLKSLIENGADWTTVINNKCNILHACAIGGNFEAAEYFISLGFTEVNLPDLDGNTPLHFACFCHSDNRIQMVKTLLQHGANVNEENEDEIFLPLLVILGQHEEKDTKVSDQDLHVIKLLIEYGADVTRKDQEGKSLIFLMTKHLEPDDFHELLQYLVSNGRGQVLHQRGSCGETILHRAVEDLDIREDTLKLLLEFGDFDLNAIDNNGKTVVDYASLAGRPQNVELVTTEINNLKESPCPQSSENIKPVTEG